MMSPRRTGRQRWVRQCSGHVYRLDLLLRQQQNAFDPIVIIIELSYCIVYRDNFDLSYRLSIGNSIWHIVTALILSKGMVLGDKDFLYWFVLQRGMWSLCWFTVPLTGLSFTIRSCLSGGATAGCAYKATAISNQLILLCNVVSSNCHYSNP